VIDAEVQRFVTEQYERAQILLKNNRAALKTLAQQLLQQETLSGSAVKEALEHGSSPESSVDGETLVGAVPADHKSDAHHAPDASPSAPVFLQT
jgi:cell division protease FtsH